MIMQAAFISLTVLVAYEAEVAPLVQPVIPGTGQPLSHRLWAVAEALPEAGPSPAGHGADQLRPGAPAAVN